MPVLIFESGPNKGSTIRVEPDKVYTLGRDERAEVRVDNDLASRVHAKLRGKDGRYYLKDSESSNGTFVNDTKIDGVHELASGDRIAIGSDVVSFFADTEAGGAAGKTLGGFQLLQRLGRGGMGTVYRALQKSLNREVALKILAPELARDQKFVEQFFKEARAAGQLNHPNIVQVYDVEEDAGLVFYAMEYMSGGTVEDRINKGGPQSIDQSIDWLLEAAKGLQYAEMKKLIHRDIKPDNLMLTDTNIVKIADLGLAMGSHEGHGETGILGTPHFIAPEQAKGEKLDTRSDLYSLGATFFRMLTGKTPFSGDSPQEILRKQVKDPPPAVKSLRSDVPDNVTAIVDRLLKKDPAQRFQTCAELIAAIEETRVVKGRGTAVAVAALVVFTAVGAAAWHFGWIGKREKTQQIVQQVVVTNEADKQKAADAEQRALRAENEAKAVSAVSELAQKRATIGDAAFVEGLRKVANDFPDTDAAGRAKTEANDVEAEIKKKQGEAEQHAAAVTAATSKLEALVDGPLRAKNFAAAYVALSDPSCGTADILADPAFVSAVDAARAKIDLAVADASSTFDRDFAASLERHDFAAASDLVTNAKSVFAGADTLPESEAKSKEALSNALKAVELAEPKIAEASTSFITATYASDLKSVIEGVNCASSFDAVRTWKPLDLEPMKTLEASLKTPEYKSVVSTLREDLEAFESVANDVRATIGKPPLSNSKVRHPERDANAEILGLGPDGQSVVLETASGVAKQKKPYPFSAFNSPTKFAQLVDGRIAPDADHAVAAVRATLAFSAAQLATVVSAVAEQMGKYDASKGWTPEQQGALKDIAIPKLDIAQLEPWLTSAAGSPNGKDLRTRVQRESRALDLLASALGPFAVQNAEVHFGLAADQLQMILDELRDTTTFFTAYPLFDSGAHVLPLVAAPK